MNQAPHNVQPLAAGELFSFRCHQHLSCFTECCRQLELALTPYDVLRLKNELRLHSADFLSSYVIVEQEKAGTLPRLYLAMVDDDRASCPFVGTQGCRVYQNRPGACRSYPVGRGVTVDEAGRKEIVHVLLREDHCLGFAESKNQTAGQYAEEQGLLPYNEHNDRVLAILLHAQVRAGKRFSRQQLEKFLLALYNLDDFRHAVREDETLAGRFSCDDASRDQVSADTELLRFGIGWLEEELFGV